MSAAENKKLIQQAFAKWAGGDADAVFKLLADDVQWTVIGSTRVSRSYQSKREFLAAVDRTTCHTNQAQRARRHRRRRQRRGAMGWARIRKERQALQSAQLLGDAVGGWQGARGRRLS